MRIIDGENFKIYSSQMLSFCQPTATNKNPNFQNLCELRKTSKYSLGSKFTNSNFLRFGKSDVLCLVSKLEVKWVILHFA